MSQKKNIFFDLKKFANRIAIFDQQEKKYTYNQLLKDSKLFNRFFLEKKLIIILADNYYEFIVFYLSAIMNNQAIIIVDSKINYEDLSNLVKNYLPDFIFSNSIKKIQSFKQVMKFKNFSLYQNKLKKKFNINSDLSLLISTSGTTGQTKYVKLNKENLFDNTQKISEVLKIKKTDKTITTMPPFYSYALSIINTHLQNGASIILNRYSLIDKNFWKLIEKLKPNNFNGVPYIFEILSKININRLNFKSFRYITQAGGSLDSELKKKILNLCKKNKTNFFIMYGQAEASPRISILLLKSTKKNNSCVGSPLRGGKISLKNKKYNKHLKTYEGELIYEGKNVFVGYSYNYKDLKNKFKKKALNTGDIGYIKNNKIYITGRKKRIVKIFGIRISLDQLERELKKNNFICSCGGNDKKLSIFIEKEQKFNISKLNEDIQRITNLNPRYFEVNTVAKFARNRAGKIQHQ